MGKEHKSSLELEQENEETITYTPRLVERILRSYLDIVYTLEGKGQQLFDRSSSKTRDYFEISDSFVRETHARPVPHGKEKARAIEDLHCAVLDIERWLPTLHRDDQELLIRYHIRQDVTLEELAAERKVTSRGSMQKRIYRAVQRLARTMERGD